MSNKVGAAFVIYGWCWDTYNNLLALEIPSEYRKDTDGNIIEWFEQQLDCDIEIFDSGKSWNRDREMYLGVSIASVFTNDIEDSFAISDLQEAQTTLSTWHPPQWLADHLKITMAQLPAYYLIMNEG